MADRARMRRFRFRLQPLVRLRTQLEKQARRDLATAMTAVNQLEQQAAAAAAGVRECAAQSADPGAIGLLARSLEVGLRRHQWRVAKDLAAANTGLERAQGDYARRSRDLEVVARLREQKRSAWRADVVRQEQAELDELAALRRPGSLFGGA